MNADPEVQARRKAAMRAFHADPVRSAGHRAQAIRNICQWNSRPEIRDMLAERMKGVRAFAQTPEALAKWRASRADAGAKRSATVLAWCPPELIGEYRRLTRSKRLSAADARAQIERIVIEREVAIKARHAGDAAAFLLRFGPIRRQGDRWNRNGHLLTAIDVVSRAERLGWKPWALAA